MSENNLFNLKSKKVAALHFLQSFGNPSMINFLQKSQIISLQYDKAIIPYLSVMAQIF